MQLHSGDSHELLPAFPRRSSPTRGRNADFILVDGDHTADGVQRRRRGPALNRLRWAARWIVLHDTLNDEVRRGITAAGAEGRPEVALRDLDFVGGHLSIAGEYENHLWGGLGLILVDRDGEAFRAAGAVDATFEDSFEVFSDFRDRRVLVAALAARAPPPQAAAAGVTRLTFVLAPGQNHFFVELAEALCDELRRLGAGAETVTAGFPSLEPGSAYV